MSTDHLVRAPVRRAAVVGLAAVCALVALGAGTVLGGLAALALGVAGIVAALAVRLPPVWWPSGLLLVAIAAPAGDLPVPGFSGLNGSISPTLLLVPLWLFAELRSGRLLEAWRGAEVGMRAAQVTGLLLIAVLVLETLLSPDLRTSSGWAVNLAVMTVLVPLLLRADSAALLARTWAVAGGVLGAYAVVEAFVLRTNLLWGWTGAGGERAAAGFGHSLTASSFFAAATVLAVVRWGQLPTRGGAVVLAGAAAGLAATGSRGGLIATGSALLLVLSVHALRQAPASRRTGPALLAVVLVFGVVAVVGLAQRTAAGQEEGSNVVRDRSLQTGLAIAASTGPLGEGPGRAYTIKTTTAGPGTDEGRSIENSWLELYIGTGVVGSICLGAFVLACAGVGARRRSWDGVAITVALLVAYLLYNALEGSKPLTMLLLGAALGLCLTGPRQAADLEAPAPSVDERSRGPTVL